MTTLFLAGPMTSVGPPTWNYPAFNAAAADLRKQGFDVLNPAENFDGDPNREYAEYLRASFFQVLQATAVVMLPGWEKSKGASIEVAMAKLLGLPRHELGRYPAVAGLET
jgi:hypothetical protein